MERDCQQHNRVNVSLIHNLRLIPGKEPDFAGVFQQIFSVFTDGGVNDLEVKVDEFWREFPRGAKVQESDFVSLWIVQEVRPVGICLHVAVQK